MSDHNIVVNSEVSDHDESIGEEVEALNSEMTSIHSGLSPTAERHDDGEEIIDAALEDASVQSAVELMSMRIYHSLVVMEIIQYSQFSSVCTQLEGVYSLF